MTDKKRILSGLGKMGTEAFMSVTSLRREIEAMGAEKLEQIAARLNLVRRDEFEILQIAITRVEKNQAAMLARIESLEEKTGIKKSSQKIKNKKNQNNNSGDEKKSVGKKSPRKK
jgi:BMFP domain-containing protein YqiC